MGYSIHIEREPPISLQEWEAAVSGIDGARIDSSDIEGVNPKTKQTIKIKGRPGTVAVRMIESSMFGFRKKESWAKQIFFDSGAGIFAATEDIENPENQTRRVVGEIARLLGAKIEGDEGEIYEW